MPKNQKATVSNYGPGDTTEIGGSRFGIWDSLGVMPNTWGQITPSASYAVPSVPPNYGDPTYSGAPVTASETAAVNASAQPFSMTQSPLLWAVIGLIGAFVAVHMVHWKGQ